ncbi:MAG: FAD-dependent oxidoreductase, partial [Chloroflexi bacterium]|nr:FAD-dependent oxidoreductase [Chloroflexota bacterium]
AVPTASLLLLQSSHTFNTVCDAELKRLLASVVGYPAFKLFLLYEERWWETALANPIDHGRSICDLPLRQTYYFRPDSCDQQPPAGCPRYGLIMASYDDARAVDYWKGMEQPPEERARNRPHLRQALTALAAAAFTGGGAAPGAGHVDPPPNLHEAPEAMRQRAKEQLALLHGMSVEDIPDPRVGAYADWSLDPWGGGWNFWQPQVDVRDVMTRVKRPLGDLDVYIVGEAYSGQQGWVEGALTTAELVLEKYFGLERAGFLPQDYYLGW